MTVILRGSTWGADTDFVYMSTSLGTLLMMLVQAPVAMEHTLRVLNTDFLPVAGVEVEVLMDGTGPQDVVDRRVTDARGEVTITYPGGKPPAAITFAKPGYRRVARDFRREYVLLRDFEADRVRRLAEMRGPEQVTAVREWLKEPG